jgi:hypothetical protein
MTILQIEAHRSNALRSNAVRHGLCAETVIEMVEDIGDHPAFEAAVADCDARRAVERELGSAWHP